MKILFNSNISEIYVYEKRAVWDISLYVGEGKRKIGYKFGIFPKYEKCYAVFKYWDNEYYSTIEEYNNNSKDKYIEGEEFYFKPHCVISSNSGEKHTVRFKTIKELHDYVEELKKLAPHIVLK